MSVDGASFSKKPSLERPAPGSLSMPELIRAAGNRVGLAEKEIDALLRIAGPESGFNARAENPYGSARGLFQFISSTWNGRDVTGKNGKRVHIPGMVDMYGEEYGFSDVMDPWDNSLAGALFLRDNVRALKREFPRREEITFGDIYAAHFLGASDEGAFKLIRACEKTPNVSAVSLFGEEIASVNGGYFYVGGDPSKPRTAAQLYDHLSKKMDRAYVEKAPAVSLSEGDTLSHTPPKQREEELKPTIDGFYHLETWKDNPAEVLKEQQNLRPRDKSVAEIQGQLHKLGYDLGPYKDKNGNKTGIDGRFGPKTKAAVIAFQKEHDLSPTGELDAATRDALNKAVPEADCALDVQSAGNQLANSGVTSEPAKKVDTALPDSRDYVKYGDSDLQYGTESTIGALREIAAQFRAQHGGEIAIGNISKEGGGHCPGHLTHKKGVDVDIRPEAKEGDGPTNWRDNATYDREATKKLIKLIQEKYPKAQILFNDPVLLKDSEVGHGLKHCDGHDNHLHVRFPG